MTEYVYDKEELVEDIESVISGLEKIKQHVEDDERADAEKHYASLVPELLELNKYLGGVDEEDVSVEIGLE